jgi:hypothetical protein
LDRSRGFGGQRIGVYFDLAEVITKSSFKEVAIRRTQWVARRTQKLMDRCRWFRTPVHSSEGISMRYTQGLDLLAILLPPQIRLRHAHDLLRHPISFPLQRIIR